LFEGPYEITRGLEHSAYEVRDAKGKLRGEFNKKQLKKYKEDTEITIVKESKENNDTSNPLTLYERKCYRMLMKKVKSR
jgi:hypothetical protein